MRILLASFIVVFVSLQCRFTGVHRMQAQNPSPMTDRTRTHRRIQKKEYPGKRFTLDHFLSKPVAIFFPEPIADQPVADILLHFHGSAFVPFYAVEKQSPKMIAAAVNLGSGSAVYDNELNDENKFSNFLRLLARRIREETGWQGQFQHIIVSSFSAGYGAVRALLRYPANLGKIDGIILLDGLHTDYVPERVTLFKGGKLNGGKLQPFLDFARLAVKGEKKMLVTHSEIFPGMYASTTETADYLLDSLHLKRTPVLQWGPLGMQQLSEAKRGNFAVLGFAGNSAPDHIDHLHGLYFFLQLLSRLN